MQKLTAAIQTITASSQTDCRLVHNLAINNKVIKLPKLNTTTAEEEEEEGVAMVTEGDYNVFK